MSEMTAKSGSGTAAGGAVRPPRINEIDIARGCAMALLCVSHSASLQLSGVGGRAGAWVDVLTFVRFSPTFMLISGVLLGYLYGLNAADFSRMRTILLDKALYLLTVAHVILMGANLLGGWSFSETLRLLYITDTIAVCMIIGCFIVPRMGFKARIATSLALLAGAQLLLELWYPGTTFGTIVKHTVVGSHRAVPHFWNLNYTLASYFALYLAATVLGEMMATRPTERGWALRFLGLGTVALVVSLLPRLGFIVVTELGLVAPYDSLLRATSPMRASPPSESFLLWNSGVGLILISAVLAVGRLGIAPWLVDTLRIMGKCSLFVFLLHAYVFFGLLMHWPPGSAAAWVVQFALAMTGIMWATRFWYGWGGNRYFTLGIARRHRRGGLRASAAAGSR